MFPVDVATHAQKVSDARPSSPVPAPPLMEIPIDMAPPVSGQ
jgi:hypothetical protein